MCAHLFVFGYTFDLWGKGNGSIITLSVCILASSCYSLALASVPKGSLALKILYDMRFYWLGFMLIIIGILGLIFFFALVAFQISDHIAIYSISSNVNLFCFVTLFPMIGIAILSLITW